MTDTQVAPQTTTHAAAGACLCSPVCACPLCTCAQQAACLCETAPGETDVSVCACGDACACGAACTCRH